MLPSKYAACDRVVVVSRAISAVVEACGIAPGRLRLVYEGVPDRSPTPGGHEVLASLGVPGGVPVIGNVAALTGHKDHATLVEAMALVRPRVPEARLVILGEGSLRGPLEALVRERGLQDRVVFAGFRRDLDRLLPAFSLFCLSSRLEGLGTSLLDAMAFGLPVVATAAGGIPEAVEDGVTGRVVPPQDPAALARYLQNAVHGLQVTVDLLQHRYHFRTTPEKNRSRIVFSHQRCQLFKDLFLFRFVCH